MLCREPAWSVLSEIPEPGEKTWHGRPDGTYERALRKVTHRRAGRQGVVGGLGAVPYRAVPSEGGAVEPARQQPLVTGDREGVGGTVEAPVEK